MPNFTDAEELKRRSIKELESSGLTDAGHAGTQTNLLIDSSTSRLGEISADNKDSFVNSYVQNATGFYLDFKGEESGMIRYGASPAIVLASDENIRIYTDRGSLRDRLGSTLPANTEITNADNSVVFVVQTTGIPAGVSEIFVAAAALNLGPSGNVGAGVLTQHGLVADGVFVTNDKPIVTGRNTEPDTFYRSRLLQHGRGATAITAEEIISQVTALPGVTSARFLPTAFGINHPAIMLTGPDKLTQNTTTQAQAITQSFLPLGTRVTFLTPNYVDIALSIGVRHTGIGNPINLTSTIPNFVTNLIRDIGPGVPYDFHRLDAEITRRYEEVLNVDPIEIRANGKVHSNKRVRLKEHEQMIVTGVTVELLN